MLRLAWEGGGDAPIEMIIVPLCGTLRQAGRATIHAELLTRCPKSTPGPRPLWRVA